MNIRFKLVDFDKDLILELDGIYDENEVREIIETAIYDYMEADEDDMEEEMLDEMNNMTIEEWIVYRLEDDYHVSNYYTETPI